MSVNVMIIYHEDIMRVVAAYTRWDLDRCGQLRRDIARGRTTPDLEQFKDLVPREVFELVIKESPWTFCKSHAFSFAQLTKQTAVLKSLHRAVYFDEISRWEDEHGLAWDDFGIKMKGVSLLQN